MVLLFMRDGGGGQQSKHSPCCMASEYKEPLSQESRNSLRENWNARKIIIWISKWKKKLKVNTSVPLHPEFLDYYLGRSYVSDPESLLFHLRKHSSGLPMVTMVSYVSPSTRRDPQLQYSKSY